MSLYQLLAQGFNPGKGMVDASATNLAGQKMKYDMEQQALQNNLVQKRADQSNLWKMLNHQQKTAQSEANNKRQVFQLQQQALSKVETPQQFEAVKSMLAESGYPLPENITFDGVKQLASSNNATFGGNSSVRTR